MFRFAVSFPLFICALAFQWPVAASTLLQLQISALSPLVESVDFILVSDSSSFVCFFMEIIWTRPENREDCAMWCRDPSVSGAGLA